jgi:uncharacterized protein (UPF0179 family)
MPILTAVDKKLSEGAKVKIDNKGCGNIGCINHELCNVILKKDKNYNIIKIYESLDCPIGYDLQKAELSEG